MDSQQVINLYSSGLENLCLIPDVFLVAISREEDKTSSGEPTILIQKDVVKEGLG